MPELLLRLKENLMSIHQHMQMDGLSKSISAVAANIQLKSPFGTELLLNSH